MGVSIKWERNNLHIQKKGDIKGLNIEVTPTTIQSDHQPFTIGGLTITVFILSAIVNAII